MIADAIAQISAIEQQLTGKTRGQLRARLTIRGYLKELRDISGQNHAASAERRSDWLQSTEALRAT
jgi:hypothetical protein